MFGDNSFLGIEDLFKQLAGEDFPRNTRNKATQKLLNTIESKKETILIFDLSGKKLISVKVKDDSEMNEYGERIHTGQKVLAIKFEDEETLKYILPKTLAKRDMEYTFSNGILEVSLRK